VNCDSVHSDSSQLSLKTGNRYLPNQVDVRRFLFFYLAVRGVHLGAGDVIPLVLMAPALGLLLAILGRGGRFNQPCDLR